MWCGVPGGEGAAEKVPFREGTEPVLNWVFERELSVTVW